VADRVVFMDQGQVMEEAPPEAFFSRPQSQRAQQFLDKLLGRAPQAA
jgi:ABC-type polar amino acid transport system ATPase subunit